MSKLLTAILFLLPVIGYAQFAVSSGTPLTVDGVITTDGSIINRSEALVFNPESGLLLASINDQLLSTNSPFILPILSITGGSVKAIEGAIVISQQLDLANGKIFVGGPIEENSLVLQNTAEITNTNPDSWVTGTLIQQGQGEKFYPLGANGQYAPMLLNIAGNDNTFTGAAAFNNRAFTPTVLPNNVAAASTNWGWVVFGSEIDGIRVTLPIQGEDEALISGDDLVYTILEADTVENISANLGGIQGTFANGLSSVTANEVSLNPNSVEEFAKVYLLGVERTTVPVIHNIITPNNDNSNDYLFIEAISIYGDDNEVILLDRWGTEVYRKKNFRNFNDTDNPYDGSFDFLAPGNYICIVTYAGQTAKQTITVLN